MVQNEASQTQQSLGRLPTGNAGFTIEQPTIHFGSGPHTPPVIDQSPQGINTTYARFLQNNKTKGFCTKWPQVSVVFTRKS